MTERRDGHSTLVWNKKTGEVMTVDLHPETNPNRWHPIDTAPKDGSHILLVRTPPYAATGNIMIAFWHDGQNVHGWVSAQSVQEVDTRIWNRWRWLPIEEYFPHGEEPYRDAIKPGY